MTPYPLLTHARDLQAFAEAQAVAQEAMAAALACVQAGQSAEAVEAAVSAVLAKRRCTAPFKRFTHTITQANGTPTLERFGYASCVSVNTGVVNGPPTPAVVFQPGDVVSVALAAECRGICAKLARTVWLPPTPEASPPEPVSRLLSAQQAFIDWQVTAGRQAGSLQDWLTAMHQVATNHGLTLLEGSCSHGIGKNHQQPPYLTTTLDDPDNDIPILPGLAWVCMLMLSTGTAPAWKPMADGWTLGTTDGGLAIHWADSILFTATPPSNA